MQSSQAVIARAARWTRWIVVLLMGATIALQLGAHFVGLPHLQLHPAGRSVTGGAIALLHGLLMILALVELWLMLRHVEQGELFSAKVTLRLRRFALFTVLAVLSAALLSPLLVLLFPDCAPDGPCVRRFPIDLRAFWTLVIALIFFLVARILDEARRLEEENKQFI